MNGYSTFVAIAVSPTYSTASGLEYSHIVFGATEDEAIENVKKQLEEEWARIEEDGAPIRSDGSPVTREEHMMNTEIHVRPVFIADEHTRRVESE